MPKPITKQQLADLWYDEFVSPEGFCSLCGNHGFIDTRGKIFTPANYGCGKRSFCICPNGRALKRCFKGWVEISIMDMGKTTNFYIEWLDDNLSKWTSYGGKGISWESNGDRSIIFFCENNDHNITSLRLTFDVKTIKEIK